jgi:hypothetical protein
MKRSVQNAASGEKNRQTLGGAGQLLGIELSLPLVSWSF